MNQLTDNGLDPATENELLDLLHVIDDDPTAVDEDLAGKIVSKILRKALAKLGLHDAVSVVFEVDDGGGFHFGVGVSSAKEASGAEIALSPDHRRPEPEHGRAVCGTGRTATVTVTLPRAGIEPGLRD